jgi:hypothetical protein
MPPHRDLFGWRAHLGRRNAWIEPIENPRALQRLQRAIKTQHRLNQSEQKRTEPNLVYAQTGILVPRSRHAALPRLWIGSAATYVDSCYLAPVLDALNCRDEAFAELWRAQKIRRLCTQ